MDSLIPLLVAVPLGGGFIMPVLGRLMRDHKIAGLLPLLIMVFLVALSLYAVGQPETIYWAGAWKFPIGISMVADGLSKLLLVIISVVGFMAVLFGVQYMTRYTSLGLYYSLFLIMIAGMNGTVLAGDLFNLFVFVEVAALASYALVAFGTESEELEAAFKYLIMGAVATTAILLGVTFIYNVTGQLNMAKVHDVLSSGAPGTAVYLAAGFFVAGFALKAAMVPFHAWLPDAHPSAPAPISAMLSGVLIKACGVYALCRLLFSVFGVQAEFGYVFVVLGALSMIIGALIATGQQDFKRMLAYSSISQVGYVILAVGVGVSLISASGGDSAIRREIAAWVLFGGFFHLLNHAVFKSLLFLASGSVEYATGTRLMARLGGLLRRMPVTAWATRAGALSISGVPPFNGFWSKLIIIGAMAWAGIQIHWGYAALAAITAAVSVMTLIYYIGMQRRVLDGEPGPDVAGAREVPLYMTVAMICLVLLCLATSAAVLPAVKNWLFEPVLNALLPAA